MSGVYVITDGTHFKIGVADDPAKRMATLQTGNPRRLELVFYIHHPKPGVLERSAHARLGHNRRLGEWFECGPDCAIWAVLACAYPGCIDDEANAA